MLKQESARSSRLYVAEKQVAMQEKKKARLSLMLSKEDFEKVVDGKSEIEEVSCCSQCELKTPFECWRHITKKGLVATRITLQSRDSPFVKFDSWRGALSDYISNFGSSVQDQKWQMKFFQFCQQKKQQNTQVPQNDVFAVAENESMLSHDNALKQSKKTQKTESEKETG